MADITKCNFEKCPFSKKCYRFTAKLSEYQSVFIIPPYNKKTKTCNEFLNINKK